MRRHLLSSLLLFVAAAAVLPNACYGLHVPSRVPGGGGGGRVHWKVTSSSSPLRGRLPPKEPTTSKRSSSSSSALYLSPQAIRLAETIAPKLGVITANALYFAPTPAVLKAAKTGDMGDLNPYPLAIMPVVALGWLAYGICARDIHVTMSNIFGSITCIGFVVGFLPVLNNNNNNNNNKIMDDDDDDKKRTLRMTQAILLAGTASTLFLWTFLGLVGASRSTICSMLGLFASGLFIILSGSPLSTIKTVLATRNSSSILGSLTIAQCTNTALWTAYGLTVKDRFIWGPNSAGLSLGLAQLALKLIFPSNRGSKS